MGASGTLLSLASLASAANYQIGGLPAVVPKSAAAILRVFAHVQLLRLLGKRRVVRAAWLAAWILRFPLGGGDWVPLVSHLARYLIWGRQSVGLRLPPAVPWALFLKTVRKNGIWKRHINERAFRESVGPIYRIYQPLSNADDRSLATMIVWVSEPSAVEQVLGDRETFPSRGPTGFSEFTKNGLLGLPTGPTHSKHRRVVSQFLSTSYLAKFSGDLTEEIEVLLVKWDKAAADESSASGPVNVHYDMSMLTLDMIMRVGLGSTERQQLVAEEDNVQNGQLDFMLREIVLRTALPFHRLVPAWFPGARARQERVAALLKIGEEQSALIREAVRAAMDTQHGGAELDKTMLSSMMVDGSMAEGEVSDELKTIKGAGHETTSNTLCWALLLLMQNPEKLGLLRAEVDARVAGNVPTFAESKALSYATMVIYETLRLYPTVPTFPRLAAKAAKVGGYDIPAGSMVFISQGAMNRDPAIWPEPLKFEPERFGPRPPDLMPSKPVGVPNSGPRFGFVPFGAGVRTCIGQRLAVMEAVKILGALVKRYNFDLELPAGETEIQEFADVTLGPKKGMPVRITRRRSPGP